MNLEKLDNDKLNKAFSLAFKAVSTTNYKFKQDTLLYFYAYYKHSNQDFTSNLDIVGTDSEKLVNAFKLNALFQVRGFSQRRCKIKYIELAIQHLGEGILKDL